MSRFALLVALTLTAFALESCSRHVAPPVTTINDDPPPPAEGPHHSVFAPIADKIRPAVVVLAAFDEHGALVANQHGFFISANGDLLAERSAMNNAASAVVKSADGHAYDIFGTYVRSAAPNFILLKTNAHDVPHLQAPSGAEVREGAAVAIVLSGNAPNTLLEGTITKRKRDETGEWLKFEPAPPDTALGAPVINESGAIIGIVAQREDTTAPAIFRATGGNNPLVASLPPNAVTPIQPSPPPAAKSTGDQTTAATNPPVSEKAPQPEKTPPAAAESPPQNAIVEATPRAEPTPPAKQQSYATEAEESATPRPRPSATPAKVLARSGKLLYSPPPRYPRGVAWLTWDGHHPGAFRLTFNSNGEASDVQTVQSTGIGRLDRAAIEALRSWRAQPGKEWTVTVPVDFRQ